MADGLAHFSGEVSSPQAELTSHQELSSCACPASEEVLREPPEQALRSQWQGPSVPRASSGFGELGCHLLSWILM